MQLNEMQIDENNIGYVPSLGLSFQMNETAKKIIELLKEGKSQDEISKVISDEFGVDYKEAYIDVEDLVLKLRIMGLL
ncbi:PqqD family protein [Caminibacter sp.]